MAFIHLHSHTEHSLCEGVMSVGDMVRRAIEFDMRAIAVTDRGYVRSSRTARCMRVSAGLI